MRPLAIPCALAGLLWIGCAYPTVPHTTARALPIGKVELGVYAGAGGGVDISTAERHPEDSDVIITDGASAAWAAGAFVRVGVAKGVDIGITGDFPTGVIADVKIELLDNETGTLAISPALGYSTLVAGQGRLSLLGDIKLGPHTITMGPAYHVFFFDDGALNALQVLIGTELEVVADLFLLQIQAIVDWRGGGSIGGGGTLAFKFRI